MPANDSPAYLSRGLEGPLQEALEDTPVVCLLGARQTGKSTLAVQFEQDRPYFTLDDDDVLELALSDPRGFIAELPEKVTIDEIQRAPELTRAIKRSVDANRDPGRFLLTGSANLLQLPRLADSLAGRMECLYLQPFTEAEKQGTTGNFLRSWLGGEVGLDLQPSSPLQPSGLPRRITEGGFPGSFQRPSSRGRRWQKQYVQAVIERDIHDIAQVKDGRDVSRLLTYLSHQNASLLNISNIAGALGHTRATIERYLVLLERLFLIRRLPAWHRNDSKRLVKTPKLHFTDSGLATSLADLGPENWTEKRQVFGHALEGFVLQQLHAQAGWMEEDIQFSHYRDKDQVEVDIVLSHGSDIWGVEIKASTSPGRTDPKGLLRLADQVGSAFRSGIVLYDGDSILPLHQDPQILAVPIHKLWDL